MALLEYIERLSAPLKTEVNTETALAQESAQRSLNAAQLSKHALQTQVRLPRGALRNSDAMEAGTCPVRLGWFQ